MRIAILSKHNYYGVVGALAKQLNKRNDVAARVITQEPSRFYEDSIPPLSLMSPKDISMVIEGILSADIVHVFDQGFMIEQKSHSGGPGQTVLIDDLLNPDNLIYTYTPEYFSQHYDKIFFKHYRSNILATGWPVYPYLKYCPLPVIHVPVVIDFDQLPTKSSKSSIPVIAISTHYGDRHHIEEIFSALLPLRENIPFSISWIENMKRKDYLLELSNADIFIDSYRSPGLTPMGLEAMAIGLTVVTNMTGLDFTIYPGVPVITATLKTLPLRIKDLLTNKINLTETSRQSSKWIKENMSPSDIATSWMRLYEHVNQKGMELE